MLCKGVSNKGSRCSEVPCGLRLFKCASQRSRLSPGSWIHVKLGWVEQQEKENSKNRKLHLLGFGVSNAHGKAGHKESISQAEVLSSYGMSMQLTKNFKNNCTFRFVISYIISWPLIIWENNDCHMLPSTPINPLNPGKKTLLTILKLYPYHSIWTSFSRLK